MVASPLVSCKEGSVPSGIPLLLNMMIALAFWGVSSAAGLALVFRYLPLSVMFQLSHFPMPRYYP